MDHWSFLYHRNVWFIGGVFCSFRQSSLCSVATVVHKGIRALRSALAYFDRTGLTARQTVHPDPGLNSYDSGVNSHINSDVNSDAPPTHLEVVAVYYLVWIVCTAVFEWVRYKVRAHYSDKLEWKYKQLQFAVPRRSDTVRPRLINMGVTAALNAEWAAHRRSSEESLIQGRCRITDPGYRLLWFFFFRPVTSLDDTECAEGAHVRGGGTRKWAYVQNNFFCVITHSFSIQILAYFCWSCLPKSLIKIIILFGFQSLMSINRVLLFN